MRARSDTAADAELLASAVALRWSRPDLTAAVAEHVGHHMGGGRPHLGGGRRLAGAR